MSTKKKKTAKDKDDNTLTVPICTTLCQTSDKEVQEQFIHLVEQTIKGITKDNMYKKLLPIIMKLYPDFNYNIFIICQSINIVNIRGWERLTFDKLYDYCNKIYDSKYPAIINTFEKKLIIHRQVVNSQITQNILDYMEQYLNKHIQETDLAEQVKKLEKRLDKKDFLRVIKDIIDEQMADKVNITLESDNDEIITEINNLYSKLDKLDKDLLKQIKENNQKLQKEVLRLTKKNTTNQLNELNIQTNTRIKELGYKIKKELEKELENKIKKELENKKSNGIDITLIQENIKKSKKIETIQSQIKTIQCQIDTIQDELTKSRKEHQSYKSKNDKLQQDINNLYKKNTELYKTVQNSNVQIKKFKEIHKYQNDKITNLESELSKLQKTVSQENKERISFQADSTATIDQLKYLYSRHDIILSMPYYQNMPFQYNTQYPQLQQPQDTVITAKPAE